MSSGAASVPVLSTTDIAPRSHSGTRLLNLTIVLSYESVQPITVDYATSDSTADAGSDNVARSGTLSFAPGDTRKTVAITIYGDTQVEGHEVRIVVQKAENI